MGPSEDLAAVQKKSSGFYQRFILGAGSNTSLVDAALQLLVN